MKFSTERPYLWLFALLAFVGLAADQASKYVVFARLRPDQPGDQTIPSEIIPGYFSLQTNFTGELDPGDTTFSFLRTISGERLPHVNRGALFGIGNSGGGMNHFFAGLSILAACFIVFWTSRPAVAKDRFLCLALGLILGGTLGNLYDRVVFGGVRDFLHCYYGTHIWPDFNVADCCLVGGAGVLLVHSFFAAEPAGQAAPAEPVDTAAPVTAAPETAMAGVESIGAIKTTSSPNGI